MSDITAVSLSRAEAIHPSAFALRELAPWTLLAAALLLLAAFVAGDQTATVHEWLHDGRHLLGFPCH
jgi:cobalt transporter subunit CbtB